MLKTLPVFSIVGPTAVGKTAAAEFLASQITADSHITGIDFVNADSRQVYQGIEVVTGADIPEGAQLQTSPQFSLSFWQSENFRWHALACLKPDQEWSVAHFQDLFSQVIFNAEQEHRLVILVGGTGLYHDSCLQTDPQLHVPPDTNIREKANHLSLNELIEWVQLVAPEKLAALNNSDRHNPRRLVRVIEIAQHNQLRTFVAENVMLQVKPNHCYCGLVDNMDAVQARIQSRVIHRWRSGAVQEVEQLIAGQTKPAATLMTATGVKEITRFLSGEWSESQTQEAWTIREIQYAKRQMTWWKKRSDVVWFDVSLPDWQIQLWQHCQKLVY